MTYLGRQLPAGPAWGGHLSLDAIVAYVDEELSPGPRRRALEHLARCSECAAEVIAQTQARWLLRRAAAPALPSSLLNSLRAIPSQAELPEPPAGLAVTADGQLVSVLREPDRPRDKHERRSLGRRARLGAGAAVTGLALGGFLVAGHLAGAGPAPASPAGAVSTASIGGAAYLSPNAPAPAGTAPVGAAAVTAPVSGPAPAPVSMPAPAPVPRSTPPAARDRHQRR